LQGTLCAARRRFHVAQFVAELIIVLETVERGHAPAAR